MASLDTTGMTGFGRQGFEKAGFKNDDIYITRHNLHQALYLGDHYEKTRYGFVFMSNSVDVEITIDTPKLMAPRVNSIKPQIVRCTLRDERSKSLIELDFEELPDGHSLKFHRGIEIDETGKKPETEITTAQDLQQTLINIYRAVRSEADPQWGADHQLRLEAREVAAQQLDTGMLPKMPICHCTQGMGVSLEFEAPQNDPAAVIVPALCRRMR